jgi:hypothetical protein
MGTNQKPGIKITKDRIHFRAAEHTDVSFIFSSWLKSNRNSTQYRELQNPVYYAQHHVMVEGLMQSSAIIVAANPEDHTQIYGYLCFERIEGYPVVHFAYVKDSFRNLGMLRLLLDEAKIDHTKPFFITHRTKMCKMLERSMTPIHNPYLAYYAYKIGMKNKKDAQNSMSEDQG